MSFTSTLEWPRIVKQRFVCKNAACSFQNQIIMEISEDGIAHCLCGSKMKTVYSKPELLVVPPITSKGCCHR